MSRLRPILFLAAWFFLVVSAAVAFFWYYWLAPTRHFSSQIWMEDHTEREQWVELQKSLRRGNWLVHESGVMLGEWGDKRWAEWLVGRMQAGKL